MTGQEAPLKNKKPTAATTFIFASLVFVAAIVLFIGYGPWGNTNFLGKSNIREEQNASKRDAYVQAQKREAYVQAQKKEAYVAVQGFVKARIKNFGTVTFPDYGEIQATRFGDHSIKIQGYVDTIDSSGIKIRTVYAARVKNTGGQWSLLKFDFSDR